MSLLPATSHANPTTPFWAVAGSGGGGGGAILIEGNTGLVSYTITDTNVNDIYSVSVPFSSVNGKYVATATFNFYGDGLNNQFQGRILETTTAGVVIAAVNTTDTPILYASCGLSLVVEYEVGNDVPVFAFQEKADSNDGSPSVSLCYTIVFYPTP